MSARLIARFLGILLIVEAIFMATSIVWGVIDGDSGAIMSFGIATAVTAVSALALILIGRAPKDIIHPREAIATVTLGWVLVGAFGAIPYLLEGAFGHFADAFFESVSGFTTTGASALTNVEVLSRSLLWWRSITQWLGGMGIIVLFIAILPRLGLGATRLFRSEVPGPITERLRPKLRHTSMILWYVYMGLTATETIVLIMLGVAPFHAVCHSFTTMATGGFSNLNASVAGFQSMAVEMTIVVFMFLAGVNFTLYFRIVQGKPQSVWKDPEFRTYVGIVLLSLIILTTALIPSMPSVTQALRFASFQVVSLQTTTGFATDDFDLYPSIARLLLVGLMFVGGSAGSTAGGIKIARIMVLWRALVNVVVKSFRPNAVTAVKIGSTPVDQETVLSVSAFFAAFIGLFFFGSLFMAILGLDPISAATSVVACLANIGPGLELVGPTQNYAFIAPAGKVVLSAMMILGRLEILTVVALLFPSFWRR
ncbi:MAG: TrkH family potassium uptake protein [Candidatus Zixiibacteriota bacterium]